MVNLAVLIYTVCGAGIGTSVILKSNVDRVLGAIGIEAEVKAVSIAEAKKPDSPAQLIMATEEIVAEFESNRSEVVPVKSIFDLAELQEKLERSLG